MTSPELAATLGITYRQLDYWVGVRYLRPPVAFPGSGTRRTWPAVEVQIARVMARLVNAGIEPGVAARAARTAHRRRVRIAGRPFAWPIQVSIAPGITAQVGP